MTEKRIYGGPDFSDSINYLNKWVAEIQRHIETLEEWAARTQNELHERIEKLEAYLRPVDLHLDSDLERAIWDILGGKLTIGVGETVEKPKEKE